MVEVEYAYFDVLKAKLNEAYAVASEARKKGMDPVDEVEIKIAKDVAGRVEGIVGPPGISEIIRKMESGGMNREGIAFEIARALASGEIIKGTKEQMIEQAVRTGVSILTEGVLVAPTEGISKVKIKGNPDGSEYVAVYYSGPIRSAGGTAAALSVVLADIARKAAGISDYRPTDSQIERYVEEVNIYEARVAHLQYKPPDDDVRQITKNCPICIDGEPTEDTEVSVHRNVAGIETNRIRGGIPLVVCEGIAQKAAKLFKYTKKLELGWDWLEKIIKVKRKADKIEIKPDFTYLEGLVAGRPVFAYPSTIGAFRLRYGRSRTNGIMAKNIHPATMILLDGFIAFGTHVKIERPGKGCVMSSCESIEPPMVKLYNGTVMKVKSIEEAEKIKKDVDEIIFLGDMLVPFGDFLKSNHPLIPSGWCEEWWQKEAEAKGATIPESARTDVLESFGFSKMHGVALHPEFTFNWENLKLEEVKALATWLEDGKIQLDGERIVEMKIKDEKNAESSGANPSNPKKYLELLLIEHRVLIEGHIVFTGSNATALLLTLGMLTNGKISKSPLMEMTAGNADEPVQVALERACGVKIKPKAPTWIGGRMGRPEKAKERAMDGSPNVLFPTGSQKLRSITKLYRTLKERNGEKTALIEISRYKCTNCGKITFIRKCDACNSNALPQKICQKCSTITESDIHCEMKTVCYDKRPIELVEIYEEMKRRLGCGSGGSDIKGVRGLSNQTKIPERLEKGFLRAKHEIFVFRDGTSRFDATDVPLTHFIPKEIGLSLEKAIELSYDKDYLGNKLVSDSQLVPLKHQDILISEGGAEYFFRVTKFIDDLLVNLYGMKPFYNLETKEEIIGHMFAGLSPHTSAAALCRVIGITKANVGYAHPYFHTAKRRNSDGDEDCIILLMDALLNFSRKYLNENRGGTMDTPLVMTSAVDPREVDDEVHCMELVTSYPLEFYHAAEKMTFPGDIKIKTIKDVLGTPEQYEQIPITHHCSDIDRGVTRTKYVQLESVPEKITSQFNLQRRIRAVDQKDAAERLILSHFIPDLYGNLRAFSRQTFRCVNCNESFRRVPLAGKCTRCGGNILLNINKGGIKKYLEISRRIVAEYELPDYLKQRLELLDKEIKNIFEDEKVKQMGLSDFV